MNKLDRIKDELILMQLAREGWLDIFDEKFERMSVEEFFKKVKK